MASEAQTRMWSRWERRFSNQYERYITPNDDLVRHSAEVIDCAPDDPLRVKARATWLYVHDTIRYKISKRWKSPRQTIYHRKGDCEDLSFLVASLLPNVGVDESEIVIGILQTPQGRVEEHAWNRVNGEIIDATGTPDVVRKLDYIERCSWTIKS